MSFEFGTVWANLDFGKLRAIDLNISVKFDQFEQALG